MNKCHLYGMYAIVLPMMFSVCDLGKHFSVPDAWTESAVDFAVDRQSDGFAFASQKRDIVNCMRKGTCSWHGLDVWETRIYYGIDGAQRVEMSLYNRGDDSDGSGLSSAELKELLGKIAAAAQPGGKIGPNPEKKKLKNGGFQYVKSWNKGDCPVSLAWGVDGAKAKGATADFVRVTMYPPSSSGETKQHAATRPGGAAFKASIKKNVKKNAEGDVWVDNVPMVDQGQKGYCAAATSERILRYYGHTIDEHEFAQMAGTTAQGGTSFGEMVDAIRTVGSKCHLGFSEIVMLTSDLKSIEKDIERYNKVAKAEGAEMISMESFTYGNSINVGEIFEAMKPKLLKKMRLKDVRYKKFLAGVKTQIDQGVPVIWGVTLGKFPEPGLPQSGGGHIRIIIGYNQKTHEILYTDSWGAGHELKRMPEDWAFTITHDAFFLRPL